MNLIKITSIMAVLLMVACQQPSEPNRAIEPSFCHHVFFWLNNPADAAERAQFEQGVQELLAIPEIKSYHVGVPASVAPREVVDGSYTYSYLVFFNSKADHDVYQEHPIHLKFINDNKHLWSRVVVYDSVME